MQLEMAPWKEESYIDESPFFCSGAGSSSTSSSSGGGSQPWANSNGEHVN